MCVFTLPLLTRALGECPDSTAPALSAGAIFNLSKLRSVPELHRVAPVQSHFPFPLLQPHGFTGPRNGPSLRIPNQASSSYSLWSIASEIFFLVIMFSQENKSSHLFWLPHMGSRNSPPLLFPCAWLSHCLTAPNSICQSRGKTLKQNTFP